MTAKKAKELASKFEQKHYTKLAEVLKFIKDEAKNGHTNTFVDGSVENLEKFQKALQKRGFRVFLEGPPSFNKRFLSVEW